MATDLTDSVVFVLRDGQWIPYTKVGMHLAYINGAAEMVGTGALAASGLTINAFDTYMAGYASLVSRWQMDAASGSQPDDKGVANATPSAGSLGDYLIGGVFNHDVATMPSGTWMGQPVPGIVRLAGGVPTAYYARNPTPSNGSPPNWFFIDVLSSGTLSIAWDGVTPTPVLLSPAGASLASNTLSPITRSVTPGRYYVCITQNLGSNSGNITASGVTIRGVGQYSPKSFNFGADIAPLTITTTPVGSGAASGTYRIAANLLTAYMPYPVIAYFNGALSAPFTISGVGGVQVSIPGAVGNINLCIQDVNTGLWRASTSMGLGSLPYTIPDTHFTSPFSETLDVATGVGTLNDAYTPYVKRATVGNFGAGNVDGFGGTANFTILCDLEFKPFQQGAQYNYIVSNLNGAKTEGWAIWLEVDGYQSVLLKAGRFGAGGSDTVYISGMSPYTGEGTGYWGTYYLGSLEVTYDGANLKMRRSGVQDGSQWTRASTRSIDASATTLKLGDGYVGKLDDVCIFNTALTTAEIIDLRARRSA